MTSGALEEPINVLSWVEIIYLLFTLTFAATDFVLSTSHFPFL